MRRRRRCPEEATHPLRKRPGPISSSSCRSIRLTKHRVSRATDTTHRDQAGTTTLGLGGASSKRGRLDNEDSQKPGAPSSLSRVGERPLLRRPKVGGGSTAAHRWIAPFAKLHWRYPMTPDPVRMHLDKKPRQSNRQGQMANQWLLFKRRIETSRLT